MANIDIDDRGGVRPEEAGCSLEGEYCGNVAGWFLCHGRSIGARTSRSNFGTGWAVWSSNPCKLLKELVGARGLEPPTSWSRTRKIQKINDLEVGIAVATGCY